MTRTIPTIVLMKDLKAIAKACPLCGVKALVPMTKGQLAKQTDGSNSVCHPNIGGCNWGFNDPDMETEPTYPQAIAERFKMADETHDTQHAKV